MIDPATRAAVRERAGNRCEYCGLAEEAEPFFRLHIEHIVARQHRGGDAPENLALACCHCNARKGTNLSAIDPATAAVVPLFHPRCDVWTAHFALNGNLLEGTTPGIQQRRRHRGTRESRRAPSYELAPLPLPQGCR